MVDFSSIAHLREDPALFAEVLATLDPSDVVELENSWEFWGRPEQQEPCGDWLTWVILAGRGAGKSRSGSEWINKTALKLPYGAQIALVGETMADVWGTMIAGPSGILSCTRPDFVPKPNKQPDNPVVLEYPNGVSCLGFSGRNPENLRGPQFYAAWCVTGNTLVTMAGGGRKRIDQITIGDIVQTRNGHRKVTAKQMTNINAAVVDVTDSFGNVLRCTPNHKILANGDFIEAGELKRGDCLCVAHASNMMGSNGTHTMAHTMSVASLVKPSDYIALCMRIASGQYQKATMCIISMRTSLITALKIWKSKREVSTCADTLSPEVLISVEYQEQTVVGSLLSGGKRESLLHASVANVERFLNRGLSSLKSIAQKYVNISRLGLCLFKKKDNAKNVELNTPQKSQRKNIVVSSATIYVMFIKEHLIRLVKLYALAVVRHLKAKGQMHVFAKENAPLITTQKSQVSGVRWLEKREPVYDITVDGDHEFFANGILVHNCDELCKFRYPNEIWDQLQFGLRLGDRPRAMVTTTPRPIQLLRDIMEDSDTVTVRGSTFDNAANLAPSALKALKKRYEGTRLGRQELYAEVLDDLPGALWTLIMIERAKKKYRKSVSVEAILPKLKRVVVAVDPSGTGASDDDVGDAQGIVVSGEYHEGGYVVLDDDTCHESPEGWAKKTSNMYHKWSADVIVAERNFGGDMVASTIHNYDKSLPVRMVSASRGKHIRAEPVSMLYEQGKVDHFASFPEMESEMCNITSSGWQGKGSPNRLDSLVWGLLELSQTEVKQELQFYVPG